MIESKKVAIDTSDAFLGGVDVRVREKEILGDVIDKTGFELDKEIWKSTYYGSDQIGAILYSGKWKGREVVLKIQGVKPELSEIIMVEGFEKQNKSKIVRPPKFFMTLPWNENLGYEAIVMEKVTGEKVLSSKELQSGDKLDRFFDFYKEYRKNCINVPWLGNEDSLEYGQKDVEKVKKMIQKLKPDSRFRKKGDIALAEKSSQAINFAWNGKKSEFMHGHFSAEDLIYQGDEVILFSNLFWKWKPRFYDAVFAYHYCIIGLTHIGDVTKEIFDDQRKMWLSKIYELGESDEDLKMINAALLERMLACLLVDGIMFVDESSEIAEHLIESTRGEIKRLTLELM